MMKINREIAKKVIIVSTLTVGLIGLDSVFNQTQATGWYLGRHSQIQGINICDGNGFDCWHPFSIV